jgi:hypothetical protein
MGNKGIRACHCFALLAASFCGCNSEDTDRLARIGRKLAARVHDLTAGSDGKLNRGWQAVRSGWDDYPIDIRVSMRLRWDKELAECKIDVLRQGSKVELTGSVPSPAAHQRALEIAESTAGVESVADWIEETPADPAETK